MKVILILTCLFLQPITNQNQRIMESSFIYINYKYGSIPAKGYEKTEEKRAGGLAGGHVTCTIDQTVYGFTDEGSGEDTHIIPSTNHPNGYWQVETITDWNAKMVGEKYMVIPVLITKQQKTDLFKLLNQYIKKAPYDYAFFGIRCASAMHDLLGDAKIIPHVAFGIVWIKYFYPSSFGKYMKSLAKKKGWQIQYYTGRKSRIWDSF